MAIETAFRLPIIDFSVGEVLKPGTPEWNTVRTQVRQALEEFGCFEAQFDKIPIHIRKGLFDALEELFQLPLQTKQRNVSKMPFHGYIGQSHALPLYESMGFDEANILTKLETLTTLLWPNNGNPTFCETIHSYSEQLSELDGMIRRMILESLGVEKYLEEHMDSTYYLLRLMKYKGPLGPADHDETSKRQLGLKAHKDKNMVTILYQNQIEGLEVQTKNEEWVSIKPSSSDSFIVMIGESLHAWANGGVHAPNHRVMMRGKEERYSVALFSMPKAGYIVKAPEELVDEDHPLLFKPFDLAQFLDFYHYQPPKKPSSDLSYYCGL